VSVGVNGLRRTYDTLGGRDLADLDVARLEGGNRPAEATTLNLELRADTAAVFGHVGITDNLDIGIAVPFVRVTMDGLSRAFRPGGGEFPPEPLAARSSGITDVAVVGKYRFWRPAQASQSGLAALVTVRLPTGDEANLRGLGETRALVTLVGSGVVGRVSPFVNVGYEVWSGGIVIPSDFLERSTVEVKDQLIYSGGLEVQLHPLLTTTVDILGRYLRGGGRIEERQFQYNPAFNEFGIVGASVLVASPKGLNTITVAPGFKWNLWGSGLLSAHVLLTATGDGLRDRITPVVGLDWAFALPTVGRSIP
jgi:hypothetical protein